VRPLVLAVLLLTASQCFAHRMPEGLTTIGLNPNTGRIDIVHRLHIHDAELGLAEIMQDAQLTLESLEMQARFALYVEQQFQLVDKASNKPLPLILVGAELQGDYVLVYQESMQALPFWLAVRQDVLREVFPDQVNKVNVSLASGIRTLMFAGEDEWKELQLPQ
jgi:hypothetical protein